MNFQYQDIFQKFYGDKGFTPLFVTQGIAAAYGKIAGRKAYAICQRGTYLETAEIQQMVQMVQLAAKTGNPIVTFYDCLGEKQPNQLDNLYWTSQLSRVIGEMSGIVPQIAVVFGNCIGTCAMQAAGADFCIMTKQAKLLLQENLLTETTQEMQDLDSAMLAEQTGVVAAVYDTVEKAISAAYDFVMLLPSNHLEKAEVLNFLVPENPLNMESYCRIRAGASLIDKDRDFELYPNYGSRNSYTALGTLCGVTVGVIATSDRYLEPESILKITRFIGLCNNYNIPIVTLVHTNGFAKEDSTDYATGAKEAARLATVYANVTVPKISILAGKVDPFIYSALCNADLAIAVSGCQIQTTTNPISNSDKQQKLWSAEDMLTAGMVQMIACPATLRSKTEEALAIILQKTSQNIPKKGCNIPL